MSSGISAGIGAFGMLAGPLGAPAAIALAVVAGAAAGYAEYEQQQAMEDAQNDSQQATVEDYGQQVDKTKMQEQAEIGELKLGEDDTKKKRQKGKAGFKIQLDKESDAKADAGASSGVQIKQPQSLGVQL